jgi:hypothetical protein
LFRVFTSKLHTFLIGENGEAITAHAEVIAKHSKGLDALINGKMAEASSGVTVLKDVLEDTFVRFCQFAYVGDYETPAFLLDRKADNSGRVSAFDLFRSASPDDQALEVADAVEKVDEAVVVAVTPRRESPTPFVDKSAEERQGWGSWGKPESKNRRSKSSILQQDFDDKFYDRKTASSITKSRGKIRGNEFPEEDYTPVFLGHARLYVFAEKWGIDALKNLTLYKLHKTLTAFKIYKARRGDIAELVKFAYSNDNTPDLEDGVDELRALIVHYVTCKLESLIESPYILAFLEQPGLFSRDLVQKMMERID